MKNILAIDTSSVYLSLALAVGDKIYKSLEKVDSRHSENIIPGINQLLTIAGIGPKDISYIAYNQGPGSFTGLRIGLSVALGMALGIKALLIPIPAFAIYALQAYESSDKNQVIIGLDARLNQLYFAGIDASTLEYFIQPQLIHPDDIVVKSAQVAIGSGFSQYRELLPQNFTQLRQLDFAYPDAGYLLKIVALGRYTPVVASQADLLYLRNKVALNLDEQKHKNS